MKRPCGAYIGHYLTALDSGVGFWQGRSMNTTHGPNAFRIPSSNHDAFVTKFERLVKAAARCGTREPRMAILGDWEKLVVERHESVGSDLGFHNETKRLIRGKLVGVCADEAKLPGYTLVAKIDHIGPEGNIVARLDGSEGDLGLHHQAPKCEHCNLIRNRNVTYIVADETGATKQIGSTCLVDYTGHPSAEAVATYAQFLAELVTSGDEDGDGDGDFGPRGVAVYHMRTVLAMAAGAIQLFGYRSRKACEPGEQSTADCVAEALGGRGRGAEELRAALATRTDAQAIAADVNKTVAFLEELAASEAPRSDYEMNLVTLWRREAIEVRFFGYVVSALGAAERAAERKRKVAEVKNVHLGEVGKRMTVRLRFQSTREFPSEYGVRVLHKFLDEQTGAQVIWWGGRHAYVTSKKGYNSRIKEGALHWVVMTVKEHNAFRGMAQTTVTRLEVVSAAWVKAEAAKAARKAERAAKKAAKAAKVDAAPTT